MSNACSPGRSCHSISNVVLNVATALLREHAVNGTVRLADAERILELIGRGTVMLDDAFRVQEGRCQKSHTRPKGNVGTRSNPFQRLMVRPFEALLAGQDPVIPRPYLANYFAFLEHALDDEREIIEQDCRAVIQALLVVHGNNLTWDHFYSDPRTMRLLHRGLRLVIHTLSTNAGHAAWARMIGQGMADLPPLASERTDRIRDILFETHRGLSAA